MATSVAAWDYSSHSAADVVDHAVESGRLQSSGIVGLRTWLASLVERDCLVAVVRGAKG